MLAPRPIPKLGHNPLSASSWLLIQYNRSYLSYLRQQREEAPWRHEKDSLTRNLINTILTNVLKHLVSLTEHSLPIYNKLRQILYEPRQSTTPPKVSHKSNNANHFVGTWEGILTLTSPEYGVRRCSWQYLDSNVSQKHVASIFANRFKRSHMPGDYDPHQCRCENLKDLRLRIVHRFVTSGSLRIRCV
jgi:hypothetical protein